MHEGNTSGPPASTKPHEYGLGALIAGVIKCLSGMRNNSVFVDVLRKLTMFVPSVHEGKMYSIDLAHQALQAYHKLFTTVVEMSRMLYPSAVDNYPRLHLVSIYLDGLKSKGISANPFSKVVESLGTVPQFVVIFLYHLDVIVVMRKFTRLTPCCCTPILLMVNNAIIALCSNSFAFGYIFLY